MAQRGRNPQNAKDRVARSSSDEEARAALQASDKLYYRIGEVSQMTGVKAHVLRYWETEFRWMAPPKSRAKQRLYRKRDIELVWLLKRLLWDERYTIAGARQRIQELGVDEALQILSQPSGSGTAIAASPPPPSPTVSPSLSPSAPAPPPEGLDPSAFQAALEEMKSELLTLRGTLLEGI